MGKRKITLEDVILFKVPGGISTDEMLFLVDWCERYESKRFIEIGRRLGGSTRFFSFLASRVGGKLISIDGDAKYLEGIKKVLSDSGLIDYVEFITAFSPWIPYDMTWEFDFLLIDGDHRFIPTLVDYQAFSYFVKKGGLIAFHDVHLEFTHRAMMRAAAEDDLKLLDRRRSLQLWEKTIPWGRKRKQPLSELR
jgi:predicted O-methyltransferase YrrM